MHYVGKKNDILTTTRLQDKLLEAFKVVAEQNHITMRNLIERSMYLYINDEEYRKKINNQLTSHYTKK
jgi:hypothetical protein